MRAAVVDSTTHVIDNIIELPDDYDASAEGAYLPPEGFITVIDDGMNAEIGGRFENNEWYKPVAVESTDVVPPIQTNALLELLKSKGIIDEADITTLIEQVSPPS